MVLYNSWLEDFEKQCIIQQYRDMLVQHNRYLWTFLSHCPHSIMYMLYISLCQVLHNSKSLIIHIVIYWYCSCAKKTQDNIHVNWKQFFNVRVSYIKNRKLINTKCIMKNRLERFLEWHICCFITIESEAHWRVCFKFDLKPF